MAGTSETHIFKRCQFCAVPSLGAMRKDKISTSKLEKVVEDIKNSDLEDHLFWFLKTAQLTLTLRKAQIQPTPDYQTIREVLNEAMGDPKQEPSPRSSPSPSSPQGHDSSSPTHDRFGNVLMEAQDELKLAEKYLLDWDASTCLKAIFSKEDGSFYRKDFTEEEAEQLDHQRRMSLEAGGQGIVGRRYSASNIEEADMNVRFEDVDTDEIFAAVKKAQNLVKDARSKETKTLLHTAHTLGDLRGAMKLGRWPVVASIVKGIDEKRLHQLAKEEMKVIKYHLKAREDQKVKRRRS